MPESHNVLELIQSIIFHLQFLTRRFAHALARLPDGEPLSRANALYAAYRLGLYQTVANSPWAGQHWRGGFARAVSLAACGRADEAAALARQLAARRQLGGQQAALADALAPFAPQLALDLIKEGDAKMGLRASLLLRAGRLDEALQCLRQATSGRAPCKPPELSLFLSNAEQGEPGQQLAHLNSFLAAYGLTPVQLRDTTLPPGQMNLLPAEPLTSAEHVHGPRVSVLMTAFNSNQRIRCALASLLGQTYRDLEVIVVDDASTDTTGDVVRAIAASDPRVMYVRMPRNVGTYVAKSIGLRLAKGEFVTCHDSDDWSHPMRLEQQVLPLLKNKRLVATVSQWVRIQDDGVYYARPVHPLMRMNPASPLFRRELVLRHAGAWDPVRTGADSEFAARLKLVFGRRAVHRVVKPLALGAHRPDSLMTAADTGYCASGMSPTRLAYWESWGLHHINELRAGRKPALSTNLLVDRKFEAPQGILVPREDIAFCLSALGLTDAQ